jgi:opacity protein-like surface antigen
MKRTIASFLVLIFSLQFTLVAQEKKTASPSQGQLANIYVSLLYHNTSDFPVTTNALAFAGESFVFRTSASSFGVTLGYGTTLFSSHQGYAGLELGFSRAKFSDLNVTDKPFYFFDLFLHFGVSPWADGRSAFYGIFGGGLVFHSEEGNDMGGLSPAASGWTPTTPLGTPPDYYLAESVGALMFGIGARFSPLSNITLSVEYRWMYDSSPETDFSSPVPGMSGWYYAHDKLDPIGNRFSVGISYVLSALE